MEADLGVLRGKGDLIPDHVAPALHVLAGAGLTDPEDDLIGAIRIALMHRSYLYENQDLLPGIDPKHLDALTVLGTAFQRRTTVIDAYQRFGTATNGLLNREINHVGTIFPMWTAEADWLRSSALLGKGYGQGELPRKVTTSLFNQLLGLLCLVGETAAAEGLLAGLLARARTSPEIVDPKTTLQQILPGKPLRFEYSRSGPDHTAVYHAIVTDPAGRRGAGDGGNKKSAGQAAALDFIQTHCLQLLPTNQTAAVERRVPGPITAPAAHSDQVAELRDIFELSTTAEGLLSQALIHKSWAFENPRIVRETGQQDNQTLAFLGSQAIHYEYTLAITRSVLGSEQVSDQGIASPRNSTYAEAFHRTRCAAGLLLGAGLAREAEVSMTLASDTFQALFAAVLVAKKFPATLEQSWPKSWQPIWDLIAPNQSRREGANPRLDGLARLIQLSIEHRIETEGPDHALRFRTTTDLDSAALGRLVTITGTFERSKPAARARTAEPLLAVIDALAEDIPTLTPELATAPVQFLVAHLATVFAADPSRHHAWARKRLLGLHLAHSSTRLLSWAQTVDRLVDNDIGPCTVQDLASAYAEAMAGTSASATTPTDDPGTTTPSGGPLTHAVRIALSAHGDGQRHHSPPA